LFVGIGRRRVFTDVAVCQLLYRGSLSRFIGPGSWNQHIWRLWYDQ